MTEENRDVSFEPVNLPSLWGSGDCLVCGERATHKLPTIGQPGLDKLPGLRWLRKMYNAPPRHTVLLVGRRKLCAIHFELAERMADDEVAERRTAQAMLNSREGMKVIAFNRGIAKALKLNDAAVEAQL